MLYMYIIYIIHVYNICYTCIYDDVILPWLSGLALWLLLIIKLAYLFISFLNNALITPWELRGINIYIYIYIYIYTSSWVI